MQIRCNSETDGKVRMREDKIYFFLALKTLFLEAFFMRKNRIEFIVKVGAFSAIAFVLQVIGSMMSIKVAGFLEVEISDLPAMIIAFAMGPWAGVMVEFIKNLLHATMTSTGFVGELANFVINGIFVFVCGALYRHKKTKNGAILALSVATVVLSLTSVLANCFIMLPLYMPQADFTERIELAMYTIAPFNFVRGATLSVITMLIYKRISGLLK